MLIKDRMILHTLFKTKSSDHSAETAKPGTWGLFQSVEGAAEATHMIRGSECLEARRLLKINLFIERAMKKDIFDIELMEGPIEGSSQRDEQTNKGHFGNWREGIKIVNTINLGISLGDKGSLKPDEGTIRIQTNNIHPFSPNCMFPGW